jgi:hypothetical protein
MLPTSSYLSLRRKDFLNTDLVNEVLATQVNQMGSLLVVRQVSTDAVDHHHDESAIIHIEPIRTADELIFAVPNEWTVKIDRQVGLIRNVSLVGLDFWGFNSGWNDTICQTCAAMKPLSAMAQLATPICRGKDGLGRSHSCNFDHRRRPETFRTAMATAFFCPTNTTSFLPRVTPV